MDTQNKNGLARRAASCARLNRPRSSRSSRRLRAELKRKTGIINDAARLIGRRFGALSDAPEVCRRLLDNRYIALREAKAAVLGLYGRKLQYGDEGCVLSALCRDLLSACGGRLSESVLSEYLSGFQSVCPLPLSELEALPFVLRAELIALLSGECEKLLKTANPEELDRRFEAIFDSLRFTGNVPHSVFERCDTVSRVLFTEPAGVYPRMDAPSRAEYRRLLAEKAKREGVPELKLARKLIEKCSKGEGRARHVGCYLLPKENSRLRQSLYIGANVLLTLFLTLLCGFLLRSAVTAALLLAPLSELTKALLDYIVLLSAAPRRIPRIEFASVPDEGRTVCVVSALLADADSGAKCAERLERLALSNRGCGKNLLFGVLADLPEAYSAEADNDEKIIAAAAEAIDALNAKYGGGFYLFTRGRTFDEGRRRYTGFERKRGALLALARLLAGEETELRVRCGDKNRLCDARFILTLDGDTSPAPDSLSELIGAMLHPMNKPVLDRDKGVVTAGHGIIHPRISVSLASASATDFSRVFCGAGGSEPYSSLCGEVYNDLFGRGGFFGKGIIDAESLLVCSGAHIPEGRVLSHDALEGAYLRGGYMSDLNFSDTFPASPLAYWSRAHRWIRGDWQNAAWIFKSGRELPDIERFRLFDSLRRSLVAPSAYAAIFAGLLLPESGLAAAAAVSLIALASGVFIALAELASGRPERLRARYHSRVLGGIALSVCQTLLRLWLLPTEARVSVSAAVLALWRSLISGKNLLEWETAAQSDAKKRGAAAYFKAMWFSVLSGALLLVFASGVPAKAAGLLWLLSPFAAAALALPARACKAPSKARRRRLLTAAREIWSYFALNCTEQDNFLPPDNYQEQPPVGKAHRTSPTNIGLALCSAMCAHRLGIIGLDEAKAFIAGMLGSMERLPRCSGHFYNWYDTRTLRPLEPRYLSSVDCGNLCVCLMALETWLRGAKLSGLAEKCARFIADADFSLFYDPQRGLMHIGVDPQKDRVSEGCYDLMASEARLTSFAAIAKGDVPSRHWRQLSRALSECGGYRGMVSWSGTMFEYLMPELFLPLMPDGLFAETARYCLYVQKRRTSRGGLWGISESAFFSLDPALNYRYKAHGCAALALKRGQDRELVIAPYASFLALAVDPDAAAANLRRLDAAGFRGRFGFYEAIDFTPSRCRSAEGEAVRCYMAHHLGMSMLAAANYLDDGFVRKMFMARPEAAAYEQLLCERVPVGAAAIPSAELSRRRPVKPVSRKWERRGGEVNYDEPRCALLSNGAYNIMLTESGICSAAWGDTLVYRTPFAQYGGGHGLELRLRYGGDELSLLPKPCSKMRYAWDFSEISCSYSGECRELSSRVTAAAGGGAGEIRIIELDAKENIPSAVLELSFEAAMADHCNYVNHPAYWRLGVEAKRDGGCLMLRRLARGRQRECWLCIACSGEATFLTDGTDADGFMAEPRITASAAVTLAAGRKTSLRFSLCPAATPEAAYAGAQRLLASGPADWGAMVSACAALTGMSAEDIDGAMDMAAALRFVRPRVPFPAKPELWRCALSGDLPIIASSGVHAEAVTKRYCLLRACGVNADLVFLTDEGGEYRKPVYSKVRDTLALHGLEVLIGSPCGVHFLPTENRELIASAAAYIVGETRPRREFSAPARPDSHSPRGRGRIPKHRLRENGDFEFYVNQSLPPRAWSVPLTNGRFGYLAADTGMGNMWLENARLMKLSPWLNNPTEKQGPETLELVTADGRYSLFASDDGADCRVVFGRGRAVWEKNFGPFGTRCTAFVPNGADARVFIVELFGEAECRLEWKCSLLLAENDDDYTAVNVDYVNHAFRAESSRAPLEGLVFSARCSEDAAGFTCDGLSWQHGEFDGRTNDLSCPVFAAEYATGPVTVLACGCCEESELIELCKPENAFAELESVKARWNSICGRLSVSGFGASGDYVNSWAVYQTFACRMLARCSMYQSGGAFGFRDQLQDAVNLILVDPKLARGQILACCAHQYEEGDVMHWWHSLGGTDCGVRSRCSDDLLWLVWALCEYTEKTGDIELCAERVYYVNSPPLSDSENDRYESPARGERAESVWKHARRALERCVSRGTGSHGLLLFLGGDWNDGMNSTGGESVWLTWLFSCCARRFSELLSSLGEDGAERWRSLASRAGAAADRAWDGDHYLRGYWPDGEAIGARGEGCELDSISQSWAAFCAEAQNTRVDTALDTTLRLLFDRQRGIIKLFEPPFAGDEREPGYIKSYGTGFRENGGQYTHAAIWLAMACFRRGRVSDGWDIMNALLPENHELQRYGAEPFVLAADVYTAANHEGEAGWSWYTGSSGWYFRVFAEELLGLKLWRGAIYVRPALPDGFPDCEIRLKTRRGPHELRFSAGGIYLDGEIYDGKGIPYN